MAGNYKLCLSPENGLEEDTEAECYNPNLDKSDSGFKVI